MSFHATHFSSSVADHFALHFLGPVEDEQQVEYEEEDEEDDGLGYYPDGTKRTLTDEQIAIFRHSEIETLLRERRQAAEAKEDMYQAEPATPFIGPVQPAKAKDDLAVKPKFEDVEAEDGELKEDSTSSQSSKKKQPYSKSKAKKGARGKERGFFKQTIKPDLRKRTWDVVDQGLGSLDYDEGSSNSTPARSAQRRRITYDDD